MKKIFTLVSGLLMTAALFAADKKPSVMLNSTRNFEVVIDGQRYVNHSKPIGINLAQGQHTIQVYRINDNGNNNDNTGNKRTTKRNRGIFGSNNNSGNMVSQSSFVLGDRDIMIHIKNNGEIMIKEKGNGKNVGNSDDRTNRDDRDFRNKKDKAEKSEDDDDDNDDYDDDKGKSKSDKMKKQKKAKHQNKGKGKK